ncbi:MAG: hypothetical protein ACI4LJ_03470 [Anaerovoracaceae bacterium]
MKLEKGRMLHVYVGKLVFRILVLGLVVWAYLRRPQYFDLIYSAEIRPGHAMPTGGWGLLGVWALLMAGMILHMMPSNWSLTMGSKKEFADYYQPVEGYDALEMYRYVQKNNISAIWVLLAWLSVNAVFGALYVWNLIGFRELILLSVFYYVCDLICVVIWCPFQQFFIKNKCCVNCRIFNWGHFMMFTPLLFIRNFFTWSLFFTSIVVMLRWEITLLKHPERFWEGSNATLTCANCQEQICRIKGRKFTDKTR